MQSDPTGSFYLNNPELQPGDRDPQWREEITAEESQIARRRALVELERQIQEQREKVARLRGGRGAFQADQRLMRLEAKRDALEIVAGASDE